MAIRSSWAATSRWTCSTSSARRTRRYASRSACSSRRPSASPENWRALWDSLSREDAAEKKKKLITDAIEQAKLETDPELKGIVRSIIGRRIEELCRKASQAALGLVEHRFQGAAALSIVHHNVPTAGLAQPANVDHAQDVGVLQPGRYARLAEHVLGGLREAHHLDRELLVQVHVQALVHLGKASNAKQFDHAVTPVDQVPGLKLARLADRAGRVRSAGRRRRTGQG